ncbi:hypothetical protein ODZ83_00235 [Acaricomes phytoseiuli]|nr:hypothetical protein [Acaricomes phytoseiuli]MCW1248644.1 hypothetical protein [Acaricomes phytoseiuli]
MVSVPSASVIKRVFFGPVNEQRLAQTREQVTNQIQQMNIQNLR